MTDTRARFRLGLFVIASFVAFAGLAILFGGAPSLFSSRSKFTIVFPEAPGVSTGTPVRKSGVRIGEVTGLDLDDATGNVRVLVQIEKRFLPRQADEPTISRGLLSGDATIDFVPKGKPDPAVQTSFYAPDIDIPGVPPISARNLLNQAQKELPKAEETIAQIVSAFRRFEQLAPKIEQTLDEFTLLARGGREMVPELRETNKKLQKLLGVDKELENDAQDDPATIRNLLQDIRTFVKTFQPVADDLRTVIAANKDDLNATIKSVRTVSDRVNDLLNDDNRKAFAGTMKNLNGGTADLANVIKIASQLFQRIDGAAEQLTARLKQAETIFDNVDKATKPIAENAPEILKNVNAASVQLAQTLADVREVARQFGRTDGTFRQLLSDPSLYQNLNEAAASLTRTLIRAERAAKDLEVFADKVARKPEVLGIGGALRPSSGLKLSPMAPSTGPILPSVPIGGPDLAPYPIVPNPSAPLPSLPPPVGVQYRPTVPLPPPIYRE
jgi:phospholipid/cholesterol/gamma-HCH transport system substrate-binding protein